MQNKIEKLPDSEFEIMKIVWSCNEPVTVMQVSKIVNEQRVYNRGTVQVLLNRLGEKGFVRVEETPKHKIYVPIVKKEDYLKETSVRFFHRVCEDNPATFLYALLDSGNATKESLAKLLDSYRE